ncbi:MAG: hypothetical protein AAB466_03275, partial [Verrucomicrobiota bacterium]
MKILISTALTSLLLLGHLLTATAQTTAFTYNGRLADSGTPANGTYELQFTLHAAASAGSALGSAIAVAPVANGLFTVTLDFGATVFSGSARYLEIGVRTNGNTGPFAILAPRQQVTSVPYAIQAANAATVSGAISDAQLSPNIPRLSGSVNFTGGVTANSFNGSGAGLANVNAATLGGLTAPSFWKLGGNSGSNPGTDFIGTGDNKALEFKVKNVRALRLEPGFGGLFGNLPNV